jgi:integrase
VSYGTLRFAALRCRRALGAIAQLVGHSGTTVTELVYRHQIRPVIQTGATVMDRLFGHGGSGA